AECTRRGFRSYEDGYTSMAATLATAFSWQRRIWRMSTAPDAGPLDEVERSRRRAFVAEHRTAVFGYPRRDDGPSMSVVYYVMDDDDRILVSTMRDRGKAKAVARDPRVSLCVLDEQWPLTYLLVYATVEVDHSLDSATDLMMRISAVMA